MPTRIYDGGLLRITLDGQTIYHETDAQIAMELSTKERITKDTVGQEIRPDQKSWSASGNALGVLEVDPAGPNDFEALFDKYDAEALVSVEFTLGASGATGDTFYKGSGYITSLELNGTEGEDATCSWSITGSGAAQKDVLP